MVSPLSAELAAPSRRHTDRLRITDGALGPVPRCELDIRPLTAFVGRQGTGKSLVAQVLYFFEELPFLVPFVESTERGAAKWETPRLVRWVLDQLRSHERAFATFASPRVRRVGALGAVRVAGRGRRAQAVVPRLQGEPPHQVRQA